MPDYSRTAFRTVAALLAALGLLPFFWVGFTSGDWNVARVTLVDPTAIVLTCAVVAYVAPEHAAAAITRLGVFGRRVPAPLLLAAVAAFIVVAGVWIARVAYNGQPAFTDELAQAFQGRILGSGRLSAAGEHHREFFETPQTVNVGGRWFAQYPIGSGVLAALADLTGAGILIYPVLLALAALALWAFAKRAYDDATARAAVILLALSPFAVFMAGMRMSHVPALALTTAALASLVRWHDARSTAAAFLWAGALGAAVGGIVLFRPYDAVLVALPIGVFQLAILWRRRELVPSLAAQLVGGLAVSAIQLWVNARTTGAPTLFAYEALNGALVRPGFHIDPLGADFTPAVGLHRVMLYLQRLDISLFESAVPGLAFVVGGMLLSRPTRWDWLLAGLMITLLAGYGVYWSEGNLNGPRFLYPGIVAFTLFSARFAVLTARSASRAGVAAALLLPLSLALAFTPSSVGNRSTGVWLRLSQMRALPASRSEHPAAEAKAAGLRNALVFVREPLHARLTARLRALGMLPFDAERVVADLDACALLDALARADAHPEVPAADRLRSVVEQATHVGPARPIPGMVGNNALSLVGGRAANAACYGEMAGDSVGTLYFARFLAASTIDSTGRIGGDVVYARWLGPRDSVLRDRFGDRDWYMYRREERANSGRFERIR